MSAIVQESSTTKKESSTTYMRNYFLADQNPLNIEQVFISDQIDENNQGGAKFHLQHENLQKPGFYYQLSGSCKVPFGFSNYQNSGNISAEINISPGSEDYRVLSSLMDVLKKHLNNRPDLRMKYMKQEEGEDFDERDFNKHHIKKQLVHYSKDKKTGKLKTEYDPSITVSVPFGFDKGSKAPGKDAEGNDLPDLRVKVPYFKLMDINKKLVENITVQNVTSLVPSKSELVYTVLKFDRISWKDGKFNINADLYMAVVIPSSSMSRPMFIQNDRSEEELMKHVNNMDNKSSGDFSNIHDEDNDEDDVPDFVPNEDA